MTVKPSLASHNFSTVVGKLLQQEKNLCSAFFHNFNIVHAAEKGIVLITSTNCRNARGNIAV